MRKKQENPKHRTVLCATEREAYKDFGRRKKNCLFFGRKSLPDLFQLTEVLGKNGEDSSNVRDFFLTILTYNMTGNQTEYRSRSIVKREKEEA